MMEWNLAAWHGIYCASGILGSDTGHHHHDQRPGVQAALLKGVKALVTVLEDMGNNFLKCSQDLLVVGTRDTLGSR